MTDRQQGKTDKPGVYQKQNTVGPKGQVGRDTPDESKERHTEIAVEAGHQDGMHDKKRR